MKIDRKAVYRIINRIQAASGPDRSIDQAIMALFYVRDSRHIGAHENSGPGGKWVGVKSDVWVDPLTGKWVTTDSDGYEFTGSVDSTITLCERVLPGVVWTVSNSDGHGNRMGRVRLNPLLSVEGNEATAPLSLLAAILTALVTEGQLP